MVSTEPSQQQQTSQVYLTFHNIVHKLNGSDGSVVWQMQLQGSQKPLWGGRYLYLKKVNDLVYAEESGKQSMVALRESDGAVVWRWQCSPALSEHSSRCIVMVYTDADRMYVHTVSGEGEEGELTTLDLRTGKPEWTRQWSDWAYPFRLVRAVDGTLFTRETTMQGKRRLCAIDGATGQERWRFEEEGASLPNDTGSMADLSPSVVDGVVYDNENPLYALDAHTGNKLWEQRTFSQDCYFSQLFVYKGVVYADTCEGYAGDFPPEFYRVFAFEAKTGKLLWQSEAGCMLGKTVWDEDLMILVRGKTEPGKGELSLTLEAREAESGRPRWQAVVGRGGTFSSVSSQINAVFSPWIHVVENRLYLLREAESSLQMFEVRSGQCLAEYSLSLPASEGILGSWLRRRRLYVVTWKRERRRDDPCYYVLYAIHLGSGATAWKFEIGPLDWERPDNWAVLLD